MTYKVHFYLYFAANLRCFSYICNWQAIKNGNNHPVTTYLHVIHMLLRTDCYGTKNETQT